MEIIIRTSGRRKKVANAQKYLNLVHEQIHSEIEANPELLGTKYIEEQDVYEDAINRVNDLLAMEREANKMRGNFFDRLNYRMYIKRNKQ